MPRQKPKSQTIYQTLVRLDTTAKSEWLIDLLTQYGVEPTRTSMETKGDLDDIRRLLDGDMAVCIRSQKSYNITTAKRIWDFLNAAQFICKPEDINSFPKIQHFRANYPDLYKTMRVWAWG